MELVGATDLLLVPIGGILFSREFLDAAAAGQFLGFVLLGIAAFQALPEVFPERYLGWGNDITSRILVAGGVVVAASLFDGFVGQLPFLDGGVFAPVTTVAVVIGVSSVTGLLTVVYGSMGVPQRRPFPNYVRYRPQDTVSPVVPPVGLLVSRVLMILVFGGLALAIISRLYPLPELFFVGVTIYAGLSGPTTVRADIAEGFISGLRAIWGGRDGVIGVSYGVGGLLFVLWLGVALTVGLENRAEVIGDPTTLLFGVVTLGLGTVHATAGLVRLIERLPNAVRTDAAFTVNKPLIPGLLLPSGALFGLYVGASTLRDDSVYLSATGPELALALALGTTAVVTLYYPSLGPGLPISDYLRIVLAPSLLFDIWGTAAYQFGGNLSLVSDGGPVVDLIVVLCVFTLFPLSPFLGYELFSTGDGTAKTADLSQLISEATSAASVFLVAVIVSYVLNGAAPLIPFGEVLRLVGGMIVIIPLEAIIIRGVLVLLYLPEQVTNWLR